MDGLLRHSLSLHKGRHESGQESERYTSDLLVMKGANKVKNAIFLLSTAAQSNGRVSAAGKCVVLPIRLCTVATRNLLMRHVPYVALALIMPAPAMSGWTGTAGEARRERRRGKAGMNPGKLDRKLE